ncbi:dTMP kinase [Lentisphaerota bacterium ZTH]|nr:dTMP kinase [Lentisphaerota bacterium]WET07669.1 dTMP kinase [Lentisphaerota bacterium ZTH]
MNSAKGFFITIEGPEGAGKSTQLQMLRDFIESHGRECIVTREPGGTPVAEQLRALIKHHNGNEPIYDQTELLLIEAARAQHVRHFIAPALERGAVVLCDRFYDSTTAYQGYARRMDLEMLHQLNSFAVGGYHPDLTILLDIDPEKGFNRTAGRTETLGEHDRFELEDLSFHKVVREGFLKIAAAEPERVKIVSAADAPEKVHSKIRELLLNAF